MGITNHNKADKEVKSILEDIQLECINFVYCNNSKVGRSFVVGSHNLAMKDNFLVNICQKKEKGY